MYICPAGYKTIGYGYRLISNEVKNTITETEANEFLLQDLDVAERIVETYTMCKLNTNQFSALVSFVFNFGSRKFKSSTLLVLLNKNNYEAAAQEFQKWIHINNEKSYGLILRRHDEQVLFETKV